ncbi:inner membrane protein YiaA [Lysinibacillus xylanilyticus]|uniref:inner membrane protein YiaA n=1 Tax=Lysinibacillus xylanilyticus TaxID=582475 RepID=UPI00382ABB9F
MSNDNKVLLDEEKRNDLKVKEERKVDRKEERKEGEPTSAFKGASWAALLVGVASYLIGLFNATMQLNEKGFYFAVLVFGLYSAISLQKAVRDKDEGIPVTNIYYGISWFALIVSIALMAIGLYNAGSIVLSEKGFFSMAFVLSLFAAITVQKNIRDTQRARERG